MELPGKRTHGSPLTRFMDVMKEDVEVTEEDTEDRNNWSWKIRCGDPCWETPKEEEDYCVESLWKTIRRTEIPERLLVLPNNLYSKQEAELRKVWTHRLALCTERRPT